MKKGKLILFLVAAATFLVAALLGSAFFNKVVAVVHERRCAANLTVLHEALTRYLKDNDGVWPQGPAPDEAGWADFWISTLRPYGIDESRWVCPAASATGIAGNDNRRIHYVPTMFDAEAWTAARWTNQPWLIEKVNAHGNGPLFCFPDGSIRDYGAVRRESAE